MVTPAAPTMPTAGDFLDTLRKEYTPLGMDEYVDAAASPRAPRIWKIRTPRRRRSTQDKYVGRHRS